MRSDNPVFSKALYDAEIRFRDVNGDMPDDNNAVAYLAGPMSWRPQFNFPAFDAASEVLRGQGFVIISPAELDHEKARAAALASPDGNPVGGDGVLSWEECLRRDIMIVADADLVIVLPEWDLSSGAKWETFTAFQFGKPVLGVYPDLEEIPKTMHPYQEVPQPDHHIWATSRPSDEVSNL